MENDKQACSITETMRGKGGILLLKKKFNIRACKQTPHTHTCMHISSP